MQTNEINVMIFWVCVAVGAIVYAAIIWSLLAYRKSKHREASFHKHTATEIAWTVIPLLIIIAMTIPAAKLLTRLYNTDGDSIEGMTPALDEETRQLGLVKEIQQADMVIGQAVSDSIRT